MTRLPIRAALAALSSLATLLALAGCGGGGGSDAGGTTPPAAAPLARMTTLASGSACAGGGLVVQAGSDANGNGALDDAEVSLSATLCSGPGGAAGAPALARWEAEPAGATCALGGTRLASGRDDDGNGLLDESEVQTRTVLCQGADRQPAGPRLHALAALAAGDADCPGGGSRLAGGFDRNGNGVLDAGEITDVQFACHAAAGAPGTTPRPLLVSLADDAACAAGGTLVLSGLDADGNGVLDAAEVMGRQSLCAGRTGAAGAGGGSGAPSLLALAAEPAGATCLAGGVRLSAGADLDRNGVLDAAEVTSAPTVCNGLAGAQAAGGARSMVALHAEPPGAACPAGGQRLDAGEDLDGNGVLDAAEITGTSFVCRGATGAAGSAGRSSQVRFTASSACPQGGSGQLVASGRDVDGNGTLDDAEITASELICPRSDGSAGSAGANGAAALVSLASSTGVQAQCPQGGRRFDAGLDSNGNGVLDAGEIADSRIVCMGTAGAEFIWQFQRSRVVQMQPDNGYWLNNVTEPYTFTLPSAPPLGSTVAIDALTGVQGWVLLQNAGQRIVTAPGGDDIAQRASLMASPLETGSAGAWRGLALSADGQLVAGVLANAKIRLSRDAGLTWHERDVARAWTAIAGSANGERYVAAVDGGALHTSSDGGTTWTARESNRAWRAVASSRDGTKLVAAAANDTLFTSTDAGATWTARGAARNWSAVAISNDGLRIVAADRGGFLYCSEDGGLTWNARENARDWVGVAISGDGLRLVALDRTSGLHFAQEFGFGWVARGPQGGAGNWSALAASAALDRVLIAADDGTLQWSEDAGATWQARASANGAVQASALALTADGLDAMVAPDGAKALRSEARRGMFATTEGTGGTLRGGSGARVELQYLGSGEWLLKKWLGTLLAE